MRGRPWNRILPDGSVQLHNYLSKFRNLGEGDILVGVILIFRQTGVLRGSIKVNRNAVGRTSADDYQSDRHDEIVS